MKIPNTCDICGSPTIKGDYGQSWWLCSNKACKKHNPNWSFDECFAPFKEEFNELNDRINSLNEIRKNRYLINIEIDEALYVGSGSGTVIINDGCSKKNIDFYQKDEEISYITDDKELIALFKSVDMDNIIKELIKLTESRNSIFSRKNDKKRKGLINMENTRGMKLSQLQESLRDVTENIGDTEVYGYDSSKCDSTPFPVGGINCEGDHVEITDRKAPGVKISEFQEMIEDVKSIIGDVEVFG